MNSLSYSSTGTKSTSPAKLSKDIFGLEVPSHDLIKQAYNAYHSNGRINLASTLTRGNVRGGGRKPWRQKGTGRARFGSSRVPIWRGGGIVFGPSGNENYKKALNLKSKRLAIRQALSLAASDKEKVITIEDVKLKAPKTAELASLLKKIGASGKVLLVSDKSDKNLETASRNLASVKIIRPKTLNVFEILNCDQLIITRPALIEVEKWLESK